ncbi:MAG: hypothetical protein RR290_00290 [Clostridia bacterium]
MLGKNNVIDIEVQNKALKLTINIKKNELDDIEYVLSLISNHEKRIRYKIDYHIGSLIN